MTRKQTTPADDNFPQGLSNPARRALANAGIARLEQLSEISEKEIADWHGIGPKGIDLLRNALAERGLSFADEKSVNKK